MRTLTVGEPGLGEVRVRHVAVGLNFADTYFRGGTYEVPLPSGLGNEAAGVVEAIGAGVTHLAVGDRVTYTGFINTLGAYSTERLISAALLIKLPEAISCEAAAAMTMRGLSAAYLVRRIYPFKAGDTVLLHAAAGGVGLIVSQWAKLLGLTVIGTASTDAKAEVARAHGCDHTINYSHEDVAKRVRELTDGRRRVRGLRQRGQGHLHVLARFPQAPRLDGLRRHRFWQNPAVRSANPRPQGLAVPDPPGPGRLHRRSGRKGGTGR